MNQSCWAGGIELRFRRRAEERIEVILQVTPLKNPYGNITGWVSSVSNITARKRAEARLAAEHRITHLLVSAQSLEGVTNAIKHGKARRIGIRLTNGADGLALTIQNDGLPFSSPHGKSAGTGVRIMNYRSHLIGASLDIKTAGGGKGPRSSARCLSSTSEPAKSAGIAGYLRQGWRRLTSCSPDAAGQVFRGRDNPTPARCL